MTQIFRRLVEVNRSQDFYLASSENNDWPQSSSSAAICVICGRRWFRLRRAVFHPWLIPSLSAAGRRCRRGTER